MLFDPDTLPGGPAYSKTGPPPRSRKSIQLSSDKYQDLVERLSNEHIEKNERRDRAV